MTIDNRNINQHIHPEERTKWNKTTEDLNMHTDKNRQADKALATNCFHVPDPPVDAASTLYYLSSDLDWKRVPTCNLAIVEGK